MYLQCLKKSLVTFLIILACLDISPATASSELLLQPDELLKELHGHGHIIVDVRPVTEYRKEHIEKAINLPVSETFDKRTTLGKVAGLEVIAKLFGKNGIDDHASIVLYDDGRIIDAARMFWVMEAFGLEHVSILDGGWAAWEKSALPVSNNAYSLKPVTFIPSVNPDRIASKFQTRLAIDDNDTAVIDARIRKQYLGFESAFPYKGHIPGAINIPSKNNFKQTGEINTLKPISELRELYRGVLDKNKVITYCNKGKESSLTYFVLRRLGVDTSHYDGSWSEWGKDKNMPISSGDQPDNPNP